MRVLVVGVGYVGSGLAADLVELGHEVSGLSRRPHKLAPGVRGLLADATCSTELSRLELTPDAIVLAISPEQRSAAAYRGSYLSATEAVLSSFPQARLILVSSTSVYSQDGGELVDDETPSVPSTDTAQVLAEAENLVLAQGQTVVRPSGIYGPGRVRLISRLCREGLNPDEESVWTNRIHQVDLRRILALLIGRPELRGTFLASDAEPSQLGEMFHWVQGMKGPSAISPPAQLSALPTRKASPRRSRRFSATRLAALGFKFTYPSFREGYGELFELEPSLLT